MNRQLKFRCWDIANEAMIYQHDQDEDGWFEVGSDGLKLMYMEQRHECGSGVAEEYWLAVESVDVKWMQFTGLQDKNGDDIYEGDILEIDLLPHSRIGSVFYADAYGTFMFNFVECGSSRASDFSDNDSHERRVIGNIYQNPELLAERQ